MSSPLHEVGTSSERDEIPERSESHSVSVSGNISGSAKNMMTTVADSIKKVDLHLAETEIVNRRSSYRRAEEEGHKKLLEHGISKELLDRLSLKLNMDDLWVQYEHENYAILNTWLSEAGLTLREKANFITELMLLDDVVKVPALSTCCDTKTCCLYVSARIKNGALWKFYTGSLSSDDAEKAVNTFSLVNALFVAIPYSMIALFGAPFWDAYIAALTGCGIKGYDVQGMFLKNYHALYNVIFGAIYSAVISLIMAMFFYILKPREKRPFEKWWVYGKHVVFMIFGGTVCSIVCTLNIAGSTLNPYSFYTSTQHICATLRNGGVTNFGDVGLGVGLFMLAFCSILSLVLML